MTYDPAGVGKALRDLFVVIGENPKHKGLVGTPDRMACAWHGICKGLIEDPYKYPHIQFCAGIGELVLVHDIILFSVCEYRLPFLYGRAHMGYIPCGGVVMGPSKLIRVIKGYARRPQVQGRLAA